MLKISLSETNLKHFQPAEDGFRLVSRNFQHFQLAESVFRLVSKVLRGLQNVQWLKLVSH